MPCTQMVTEQVSVYWVMEARRASVAKGVRQEDAIQSMDAVEAGSEVSVVLPLTEPNVARVRSERRPASDRTERCPLEGEQPSSSSVMPSANAAGRPQ